MNKMKNVYIILIVIFAVIIFLAAISILIWYFYENTNQTFKYTISKSDLRQNDEFYDKYSDQTKAYLKGVYPKAENFINKLSSIQAALVYNSLSFYYNPCFSQEANDNFANAIPSLDTEACSKYKLPYPPQGFMFDVVSYKQGKPFIFSNSSNRFKLTISNTPQIPWGNGNGGCGEGPEDVSDSDWGKTKDTEYFMPYASGPGPFWILGYTLIKHIYYPHGPDNKTINKTKGSNQIFDPYTWYVTDYQSSDDYVWPSKNSNFETKWYLKGFKEGYYIEVTHSDTTPGMAQSQGFWMNGFPGGGTGLFYKIHKTFVSNNKLDTLLNLLYELKSSTNISIPIDKNFWKDYDWIPNDRKIDWTKYSNGSDILKYWYGTDDPYVICWKYIAGNDNTTDSSDSFDVNSSNIPKPSSTTNSIWTPKAITSSSTADTPAYLVDPSLWYMLDNGDGALGVSGLMNPYGKTWLESSCPINPTNNGNSDGFDINNIGKPFPYGTNKTLSFLDLVRFQNGIDQSSQPTWQQCKNAIDFAASNASYYYSRVNVVVSLDEAIYWCANLLGYETIQMPRSANSNGYWQYEIIHTVVPDDEWSKLVKARVYPFMTGNDTVDETDNPAYTTKAEVLWMDYMSSLITIRDPFHLYNNTKASNVKIGGFDAGTSEVGTCDPTFTYSLDSKNYCADAGEWGCCSNATKFTGKEQNGIFIPSDKKCYPTWSNIYDYRTISNYYSTLDIYSGISENCDSTNSDNSGVTCLKICGNSTSNSSVSSNQKLALVPFENLLRRSDKKQKMLRALAGRPNK